MDPKQRPQEAPARRLALPRLPKACQLKTSRTSGDGCWAQGYSRVILSLSGAFLTINRACDIQTAHQFPPWSLQQEPGQ